MAILPEPLQARESLSENLHMPIWKEKNEEVRQVRCSALVITDSEEGLITHMCFPMPILVQPGQRATTSYFLNKS